MKVYPLLIKTVLISYLDIKNNLICLFDKSFKTHGGYIPLKTALKT